MSQSYYQPPSSYPAPPAPTNTMAIISLIASILGVTLVPTLGSILGLIFGYIARKQIAESGGTQGGAGLATAGIIIGWIGVGLAVLGVCLFLLVWGGILGTGLGLSWCAFMESGY